MSFFWSLKWVLPGFTGFYRILPSFTDFVSNRDLAGDFCFPDFTGLGCPIFFVVKTGLIGFYFGLSILIAFDWF